jgi:hypothetical protein
MHVEWFKLVLWNGLVDSFMWFGLVWFDATVNNYDGGVGWGDDKKASWFGVGELWFSNLW